MNESPPLWKRLLLAPWFLLRPILGWFRGAPRWLQVILSVSLIFAVGVGSLAAWNKLRARREARTVRQQWEQFEQATKAGQLPAMKQALQDLIQFKPDDALAQRRLQALEQLDSDPTDESMVFLTMRLALQQQNISAAAREALKRLNQQPKDWFARCIVALHKLQQGDRDGANRELDQLVNPADETARVHPAGLLLSFRLFRALNRDTAGLRKFVQDQVSLFIRNPNIETLATPEKLSLVECFLEGLDPRQERLPPNMVQSFAPLNNLWRGACDEALAKPDLAILAQAARPMPRVELFIRQLVRDQAMPAEQAQTLLTELEQRTQKLWQEVRQLDPTLAESYRAEAQSLLRQNNFMAARQLVEQGLSQARSDPELVNLFSRMLQLEGKADQAYANLMDTALQQPEQAPLWWSLAAEAAIAANRRDLALEACHKIRQRDPKNIWAIRMEALLWIDADQPQRGLKLLEELGQDRLFEQPLLVRAYTRAVASVETDEKVRAVLTRAEARSRAVNQAGFVVAALTGWLEVAAQRHQAELGRTIADLAERWLEVWPDELPLMRLRAEARVLAAEHASPRWPLPRVGIAITAVERIRAAQPDELRWTLLLARLQLYGEQNPSLAYRTVVSTLPESLYGQLSSDALILLGTIYRHNRREEQAVAVLERAARLRDAPAGAFIQLAWAYQQLGRTAEALSTLNIARGMPRSEQEQADYVAAAKLIAP